MTLIRLAVTCPRCGRSPNRRIFPETAAMHRHADPDKPIETHKCTGCGEVYVITAKAYKEAS